MISKKIKIVYALPFYLICLFFLVLPLVALICECKQGGFQGLYSVLKSSTYQKSFINSMCLSVISALEAALLGSLIALHWAKKAKTNGLIMAVLNFGANNGGISLAFAMIATIGTNGMITNIVRSMGIHALDNFQLASFVGLNLAYVGFLTPYMTIIFMPAVNCINPDASKAAKTLGASRLYYLRTVGIPLILPSLLSCMCLAFLNALGTYALVQAISSRLNLITTQIGLSMESSIFQKSDASYLSLCLVIFMAVFVIIYQKAKKYAERWR